MCEMSKSVMGRHFSLSFTVVRDDVVVGDLGEGRGSEKSYCSVRRANNERWSG